MTQLSGASAAPLPAQHHVANPHGTFAALAWPRCGNIEALHRTTSIRPHAA